MKKAEASPRETDCSKARFPFQSNFLFNLGLNTPYEQYALYGSIGVATFGSFRPLKKHYYLNKYLNTQDSRLKLSYAFIGGLQQYEINAGYIALDAYRQTTRRLIAIPIAFVALESMKILYNTTTLS